MKFEDQWVIRFCNWCGRDTQHRITECFTNEGMYTGNIVRCHECPIDH